MSMNVIFKPLNLQRKPIIYGIFACMFFYLVLRAIYVAPLLDELGTLIWYIQSGNILNDKAVLDANNHLLNSFVGHYLYLTFGDHLLVYRLLPILCFPIYFFSTKKLVERNIKSFQFLIFLALICIHWVFDYFGLSRGYAPSLAFFMLGLSMISHWNHAFKFRYLILILLCSLICILSNLSMIVPIILLYAYLMLTLLFRWRTVSRHQKIGVIFISMVYFSLLFVIYLHISKLKNANAFWWGSQQGLWEVTGKSLSKNVLYTESEIVKYGILLLIVILSLVFIHKFLRGAKDFIYSLPFWAFSLFVLALLSAEVMVYALDVNYPQDRVAMYLVILLILSLGGLLSEIKGLKWLLLLLLWFPISFIGKVNLKSTIFSPEDRLSNSFFKEIQSLISKDDFISSDYVGHFCYAYHALQRTPKCLFLMNQLL